MTDTAARRYLKILAATLAACLGTLAAASMVIDPWMVFGGTFNQRNFEPNSRFVKIEHLRRHLEFDSFIMGESRVNGIPVDTAQRYLGGRFYNLTAGGDTPDGMYLRYLWLRSTRKVKTLVLPISHDDFFGTGWAWDREHPLVSGQGWTQFYARNIFVNPRWLATTVYGNLIKTDTWYHLDLANGQYSFPLFEKRMADDIAAYARERMCQPAPVIARPSEQRYQIFRKLVETARADGVTVVVMIMPDHLNTFRSYDPAAYQEWRQRIAAMVGPLWDFSGDNTVTRDDRFHYECRHFTRDAGRLALMKMFDPTNPDLAAHPDFGILLSPNPSEVPSRGKL